MVTVIGEPEALGDAMVVAARRAAEVIDMTKHQGQHPRMGAVDVVPFIPVRGCTIEEADTVAKSVAKRMGEELGIPCFLYEKVPALPIGPIWRISVKGSLRECLKNGKNGVETGFRS